MTADLNQRLSNLGDHLDAERTTLTSQRSPQRIAGVRPTLHHPAGAPQKQTPWTKALVAAACVLAVGLASFGYLQRSANDEAIEVAVGEPIDVVPAQGQETDVENEPGPEFTAPGSDQPIPSGQKATVRTDDCEVRVRVYNANRIAGLATRFSATLMDRIAADETLSGTILPPRNAPIWDGDTAWLVGPDATCLDLTRLGIPDPQDAMVGNLDESWAKIGLPNADDTIADVDASTIIIIFGIQHTP